MNDAPIHRAADSDEANGAGPTGNRHYWTAGLQEVAATHRTAAQDARASGELEAAARHLRAAARVEQVVEDLRLLAVDRGDDRREFDKGQHATES